MSNEMASFIRQLDWEALQQSLDEYGYAKLPRLLSPAACMSFISSYEDEALYRKTIDMARYRFGMGEYKYFADPLPNQLRQLREELYPELAKAANRWSEQLNKTAAYPASLEEFLEQCHQAGQLRPTPLILKYETNGYNCLHQDLYGDRFFPFQVVFALGQRNKDYTGGEFLLVEQRPRAQSRGHVLTLEQGEGLIFPTQHRPVSGMRGYYRITLRHGVGTITSGTRYSLGIIFHDAK
ncbi:prolyl 4-hydroxylase subunit alpha [Paenibacillus sp. BIHB 4019]|uniref:Prolyl 4-hydroxylase subunit alpha n=1 Tax=Paenibacillus sp. BIHB 4019 TaxID=1870819 RepID=A0A1B2DMU2_9BACL|nr:2OG-Fe(II) oxygenase [Paenibacillus sp. BIHB 4019]ANY69032.1 prolyl 4-hydroxylase subunit alpha [Paenibacillus sp. BIHB 4019]